MSVTERVRFLTCDGRDEEERGVGAQPREVQSDLFAHVVANVFYRHVPWPLWVVGGVDGGVRW